MAEGISVGFAAIDITPETDRQTIWHRIGNPVSEPVPIRDRLFARACSLATERGLPFHAGGILSSDTFYQDDPDAWKQWAQYGVLAVEMETNALYTLASRASARALTICTVSDSLVTGDDLPAGERERSFHAMIELALDTAVAEMEPART